MIGRYLLFEGDDYYPHQGGWSDARMVSEMFDEACRFVAAYESGREPPRVSEDLAKCISALAERERGADWADHYLIVAVKSW